MWFLIKGSFWFSLVLVLLPFLDPASDAALKDGPTVELTGTFVAANEAITYIGAMCEEKPDVCAKGAETFVALGHRAREGARIAYEFLGDRFVEPDKAVMTGTVEPASAVMQPEPPGAALAQAATEEDATPSRLPVPEKRIQPAGS